MISSKTFKLKRGSELVWGRERPGGASADQHRPAVTGTGPRGARGWDLEGPQSWEGLAKL